MAAQMLRFARKSNNVKFLGKYLLRASKDTSNAKILNQCTCRWLSSLNSVMFSENMASRACGSSASSKWLSNKMGKGLFVRWLANESRQKKDSSVLGKLMETQEQPQTQLTVGGKGALLWYVFSELFLGFSPNKVYTYALKQVLANGEVVEELGEPIMGHGETNRRGRRCHVSYQEYIVDGENYMRVKFYVTGQKRKGTVHVDVKQSINYHDHEICTLTGHGMPWGDWSSPIHCTCGLCGIKTRVERAQGKGDDSALNDAICYCCRLRRRN